MTWKDRQMCLNNTYNSISCIYNAECSSIDGGKLNH